MAGSCTLEILGAVTLAFLALKLGKLLWVTFRPGHDLAVRYKATDSTWAVVTGASDGIGKAFAKLLAQRGFNIVLVSRTPEKLQTAANEIKEAAPNAQTRIVAVDMSTETQEVQFDKLQNAIKGLDVAVLINNAGMAPDPEYLHSYGPIELEQARGTIAVNVESFTTVLRAVTPSIVSRGSGGIINVASLAGVAGLPLCTVYSGTKGYNNALSRALSGELRPSNIDVLSFTPLFVSTAMARVRPSLTVPTAEAASASALRSLGYEDATIGVFAHKVLALVLSVAPAFGGKQMMDKMLAARRKVAEKRKAQ